MQCFKFLSHMLWLKSHISWSAVGHSQRCWRLDSRNRGNLVFVIYKAFHVLKITATPSYLSKPFFTDFSPPESLSPLLLLFYVQSHWSSESISPEVYLCACVCVHGPDLSGGDDKSSKIQSCSFRPESLQLFWTLCFPLVSLSRPPPTILAFQ